MQYQLTNINGFDVNTIKTIEVLGDHKYTITFKNNKVITIINWYHKIGLRYLDKFVWSK